MLDGFLTQAETAAALGITEQCLRDWRRQDKGPPFKLRALKFAVYDRDELVAWCEKNNAPCVLPAAAEAGEEPEASQADPPPGSSDG